MADARLHLAVVLEQGAGPICGTVADEDGRAVAFTGWLELMSLVDNACARAVQDEAGVTSATRTDATDERSGVRSTAADLREGARMAGLSSDAGERNRAMWASGDWDQVADDMAVAGRRLLERVGGIGPGVRLLDVGTGSGGAVAIPAARLGADVSGCDVVDAWFPAARRRADAAGVAVEWIVADAAELPYEDASFDIVTSTFGHMFAPDHQAAARELVRVCRPGGTIGICCWTPQGNFGRFIASIVVLLLPLPDGFRPPVLWGSEPHVAELLEPLGVTLDMRRTTLTLAFDSPEAQLSSWEADFAPVVTAKAALGPDAWPGARAALLELFVEINEREDGTMAAEYEYLETVVRVPER